MRLNFCKSSFLSLSRTCFQPLKNAKYCSTTCLSPPNHKFSHNPVSSPCRPHQSKTFFSSSLCSKLNEPSDPIISPYLAPTTNSPLSPSPPLTTTTTTNGPANPAMAEDVVLASKQAIPFVEFQLEEGWLRINWAREFEKEEREGSETTKKDQTKGSLLRQKSATLSQLAEMSGGRPRDLRAFKPSLPIRSPLIVVREKSILFIVDPLKTVIYFDRVHFFQADDPSTSRLLKGKFLERLKKADGPYFEIRALEALMVTSVKAMRYELEGMEQEAKDLMDMLSERQTSAALQQLLDCTQQINSYLNKTHQLTNQFWQILSSDEDMSKMYLSEIASGSVRSVEQHQEIELVFETFHHAFSELHQRAAELRANVGLTQQFLEVHFDSQRNLLMRFNIGLTAATLSVSLGALGSGLFGMNLINHLETHPNAFYVVVSCLGGAGITSALATWNLYNRTKEKAVHIKLP